MNMLGKRSQISHSDEASLVMSSLGGDRDAFCEIVSRYQNLLCSLAYSSVGDLKHSEDIAQEVFVEAWKKLDTLREPEKLKSWLCGILRFKVSRYRRKERRQPLTSAEELEVDSHQSSAHGMLEDVAIKEQEQALLWQALDKMDASYREPLVLFYRENQSAEQVAQELELTLDTTKQRLSRGRKLLKQAMITFVEESLAKTKPGAGFTAGVLAAISGIAPPQAKAAVWGAGATGLWSHLLAILASVAAFSGFISSFFGLRAGLDQARTQQERKQTIIGAALFLLVAIAYVLGLFGLMQLASAKGANTAIYAVFSQLLVLAFVVIYVFLVVYLFNDIARLREQERIFNPQAFVRKVDQKSSSLRQYKTRLALFGVPLIHFQLGTPEVGDKPAYAWIAGGAYAKGLLFAWGGMAIAPISVGIISVGFITVGAVGIGILGTGTVAIGIISFGASAIGYKAYASLSALGWESAFSNGFSMALDAAIGRFAFAAQVNNKQASEIVNVILFGQSHQWILAGITLLVLVPAIWYSNKVRQRMR